MENNLPVPVRAVYPKLTEYYLQRIYEALGKGMFSDSLLARYAGVAPKHFRFWRLLSTLDMPATKDHKDLFAAIGEKQAIQARDYQEHTLSAAIASDVPETIQRHAARFLPELRDEPDDALAHGIPNTLLEQELLAQGVAADYTGGLLESNTPDHEQHRAGLEQTQPVGELLAGPAYSCKQFSREFFPEFVTHEFAAWQSELMEWGTALQPGTPPIEHIISIINRDGGKSTILEIVTAFACVTGRRGYAVYLSGTQNQANDHVTNISGMLQNKKLNEAFPGAGEVALDKNNRSLGWKAARLTSKAGFTIDAIGINKQMRGAKIDHKRIDLLIIDDIDSDEDTPYRTEAKLQALSRKILPAGSGNLAVMGGQNLITSYSVFSRFKAGGTDVLKANVLGPIPAVYDLKTDPENPLEEYSVDGVKIVGGTPSWEGFPLAKAQNVIDLVGIRPFLAEYQHETDVMGGLAFGRQWRQNIHRAVLDSNNIPEGYKISSVYDYGQKRPWAFLIYAIADGIDPLLINDQLVVLPRGSIIILHEVYGWTGEVNQGDGASSAEQADKFLAECNMLPYGDRIQCGPADGSIFTLNPETGQSIADVHRKKHMRWKPSDKSPGSRKMGADAFRAMLVSTIKFYAEVDEDDEPCIIISADCENTLRTVPNLPSDPRPGKDGDVDTTSEDHLWDCIRYIILSSASLVEVKVKKG